VTTTGSRRARWRQRWAARENQRRQQAHAIALAAWQRQDEQARRLVDVARIARPDPPGDGLASLRLTRDEAVYWTGTGALVEPSYEPALRPPDHPEVDLTPATGPVLAGVGVAARQVDTGSVTVTSKRVIFVGRSRREWAFGKMTGLAHTASGQTLMRVSNRVKVSGLVFAPDVVSLFRFHLAVARADAARDRAGLVARLQAQADRHRALRPPPVEPAAAQQAPASAFFGPGVLTAIAASAVLLVSLCCVGTVIAGNGNEASVSTPDAGAAPASPSPRPTRPASPSPVRSPSPEASPARPAAEPEAGADRAAAAAAAPAGDCAAYADSAGWCVDGIGDYDCAGGSGNGPGYAPEGVRVVDPGHDPFGLDRDGDGIGCDPDRAPAPPANPPPPPPPASTDPRFGTCAEAKANGYGPYRAGEPEYDWYRDADNDGVVCE
jgi:hypothetical protein